MINKSLFSSDSGEWGTPKDLFDKLNVKFNFTLDPCATKENAKCKHYLTKVDDGLRCSWQCATVFMNPPYGREIKDWILKCNYEQEDGCFIVGLLPVRTDTKWFQLIRDKRNVHIDFLPGRLTFEGAPSTAPFPSMLVYWL